MAKQIEEKIELSEGEIKAIELQLAGKIEIWTEDEEIQKNLTSVIDKADALMEKYNCYDELNGDLIRWFYNEYKKQNA